MNGVMIPGVSAGSNQVGASEVCTAQTSSPCGPVAFAPRTPAPAASIAPAMTARRDNSGPCRSAAHGFGSSFRLIVPPAFWLVSQAGHTAPGRACPMLIQAPTPINRVRRGASIIELSGKRPQLGAQRLRVAAGQRFLDGEVPALPNGQCGGQQIPAFP